MTEPLFEILAYEDTPLGPLCLRRRELLSEPGTVVTEVTLNHQFLMSSLHTDSERALAEVALDMHAGEDLTVLIGGLGLGYTARAALACDRVAVVEVVELLPQVIGWIERGMVPLATELNADRRLCVRRGDVYARLTGAPAARFDVVLVDVDHSPEDTLAGASAAYYTRPGLERAREHLAPGGVLGVWSYAQHSPFAETLREVFDQVEVRPVTYFNRHVREEHTDWLFFAVRY